MDMKKEQKNKNATCRAVREESSDVTPNPVSGIGNVARGFAR
jgi:hypothetical protein